MNILEMFNIKEMHNAYKNKDVEKILSFYSQQAKIVQVVVKTGNKNIFMGHKEIGNLYKELFSEIFDYEYFDENLVS